jgi:hypothetical protein
VLITMFLIMVVRAMPSASFLSARTSSGWRVGRDRRRRRLRWEGCVRPVASSSELSSFESSSESIDSSRSSELDGPPVSDPSSILPSVSSRDPLRCPPPVPALWSIVIFLPLLLDAQSA